MYLPADSPYAELEAVLDSWTKQSFTGIRALPEALEHGFRQKALYETVMRGVLIHNHDLADETNTCYATNLNTIAERSALHGLGILHDIASAF